MSKIAPNRYGISVEVCRVFNASLERAFKAPILGDATKFLDGFLFQPPVIGFEEDDRWGEVGGVRYPVIRGNLFVAGGRLFTDEIIERRDDSYWKWMVYDITTKSLWFTQKGVGEWFVEALEPMKIMVRYKYTYYPVYFGVSDPLDSEL